MSDAVTTRFSKIPNLSYRVKIGSMQNAYIE
jgi:hypothetical protein